MAENAEHPQRLQLAERLDALWAMLAHRGQAQPASLRDCWRLAGEMQILAQRSGMPAFALILKRLSSGFAHRAGDGTALSFDETVDLAAWCETAALGLRDGMTGEEVSLLLMIDEVRWLPAGDVANKAACLDLLRTEFMPALAAPATASPTEIAGHASTAGQHAHLRQQLEALGVETVGLDEADITALAEVMLAEQPQAPAIEGLSDGHAESDGCSAQGEVEAARSALESQGIDLTGLDAEDLLALSQAFASTAGDEPAAQPVTSGSDSLPAVSAAQREASADLVTESEAPIWIANEELELTRTAIAEQVIPLVMALVEAGDDRARAVARDDLAYQLGLIGNAMELFGVPSLHHLLLAMADHSAGLEPDGEALLRISAALLSYLDAADRDMATLLGDVAEESKLVSAGFGSALLKDTVRVCIGIDPALIAQRKRHAEAEDLTLAPAPDVLPNVLSSMLRELPGNAARLGSSIRALVETGDVGSMEEARRVAHTLKGDANTVGVRGLANLTHSLEDVLIELHKSPDRLNRGLRAFLLEAADVVEECADHLLGRGPAPVSLAATFQQALDWSNALFEGTAIHSAAAPAATSAPSAPATGQVAPAAQDAVTSDAAQSLAVDIRLLDELQRLAGELLVLSRQIDQQIDFLGEVEKEMRRESEVERRLTSQLDDLVALRGAALQSAVLHATQQVDALEMDQYSELHTVSRQLIESHSDNQELLRRANRALRELDPLRGQHRRLNDELQRAVGRTRTLPFAEIAPRLQRVVRQTARQVGKDVDLNILGESVAIDAEMLERLVEPISHLLRNAIDHGIEQADTRRAAGKAIKGQVTLRVSTAGDSAIVTVGDDGQGLDLKAIRAKAERIGLVDADVSLADDAVARLVLAPGFSTREAVSQVSGRGVGMDVVNQRVRELRGTLSLHSDPGRGATVSLRLPMSRTLADVIVVHGHDASMAVVAGAVERIVQLTPDQMGLDESQRISMEIDGQRYPASTLESLFSGQRMQSLPGERACLGLIVSGVDTQRRVLCVREVAEVTRAVVKPISPYLPPIPAVRGVTQLGDGRLVSVVDAESMLGQFAGDSRWNAFADSLDKPTLPRIVVADDSLSVRRALEQLMQDAGYDVAAARDGLEALQMIAERPPVAVLLDLEMPRMNGLDVCRYLRNQSSSCDLPVVMITSRASDKYKLMAEEAGVTRLLGKPFSEDALVTLVRELVAEVAERHGETLFE